MSAKNKDMLEFIYVCLILGYKGKFSVDDDGDKKLHLLMENIASAVAPTLHTDEMKAFELAYADNIKENIWSKYGYILKKLTFIVIPLVIILLFYISNYFIGSRGYRRCGCDRHGHQLSEEEAG